MVRSHICAGITAGRRYADVAAVSDRIKCKFAVNGTVILHIEGALFLSKVLEHLSRGSMDQHCRAGLHGPAPGARRGAAAQPRWILFWSSRLISGIFRQARLTPLLPDCAKTVSEPDPHHPTTLLFERKQIPRIVVTIRNSRNSIDHPEPISLPWAQGVGRSNRPAPTNRISGLGRFYGRQNGGGFFTLGETLGSRLDFGFQA